jgi:alpha-L-rhamnosidase
MSSYTLKNLRCEYKVNPIGIDVAIPRLSWVGESERKSASQQAYRILVSDSIELLKKDKGNLWDSKLTKSNQSLHVEYGGKKLKSHQKCYWKVMVTDEQGKESSWSDIQTWTVGFLTKKEWKGSWIRHNLVLSNRYPLFRKEFKSKKKIKNAYLYSTAKGIYHVTFNGENITEDLFTPGWTDFSKRQLYNCYEITNLIKNNNCIGIELGDGWYRGFLAFNRRACHYGNVISFLANIVINYEDGSCEKIVTDDSWKTIFGPTIASDFYNGEQVDSQLEPKGWDKVGFKDSHWEPVVCEQLNFDNVVVQSYPAETVSRTEEMRAIKMWNVAPGKTVFDFGQNFAGRVKIKCRGKGGTVLRLRFAEIINKDKTLYTDNLRSAISTDTYITNGKKNEEWEPKFTFHGFRYAEVTGFQHTPKLDDVIGYVIGSNTTRVGDFECSNKIVNQVYKNAVWTQRANFLEVPTDCPQRDERLGWTGDAQVFIRSAICNMDTAAFFTKWMNDVNDAQHDYGAFTNVAPDVLQSNGDAAWGDAGVVCPWVLYQCYEDIDLLKNCYPYMKKWISFLKNTSEKWLRKPGIKHSGGITFSFGDWLSINANTPKEVIQTAYFAFATETVLNAAQVLGEKKDITTYKKILKNIKTAFNKNFVSKNGKIRGDTQTAYVLALHFNLLDDAMNKKVIKHLVKNIESRGTHISTGFVGTAYIMQALRDHGALDTAYKLLENKTFPSWGFSVVNGATTIWERWNSWTKERGPGPVNMNSYSHYAYGAVTEWLFDTVAGIDRSEKGFQKFKLKPQPGGKLKHAKASFDSPYGMIKSAWKKSTKGFNYEIEIPTNTTATIELPTSNTKSIKLDGESVNNLKTLNGKSCFELPSGQYKVFWSK